MRQRSPILAVPSGDRYWCVKLEGKGEHHFRFPSFALAGRVQDWVSASQLEGKGASCLFSGVMIGACWHHRGKTLEASLTVRSTDEEIDAIAEAVIDELQEAGYSVGEINTMAHPCDKQLATWIRTQTQVVRAALANFKMGQQETGPQPAVA